MSEANKGGLEGVVVADISTSFIDGNEGILIYAGYRIEDLAENNVLFEEVCHLMWHNRLPNRQELEDLRYQIASGAHLPTSVINMMKAQPKGANPMAVLRTAVSALSLYDTDAENLTDREVAFKKAIRLTGQIATITAAWDRIRKGKEPIAPRVDLT
ncbi:MAG: citrate synthase, partial [Phototrophicales bacterium]